MPAPRPPNLRALLLTVYLPTFLFAVGQGAVIPIIPLTARELGGSLAFASLVVALRGIGLLCFDVPAGWLVARVGERRAMAIGTAIILLALTVAIGSRDLMLFAACTFVMGCGWSVWLLARFSYVTDVLPATMRGRALSTLGGVTRAGAFVGPLLGAALTRS
jgi:MFS family permease